jgi:hypothetical protein
MVMSRASSKDTSRRRSRADAGFQEGPAAKKFGKAQDGLRRPSKATQKPWPVSKLNAFAMPLEQFGWGKLLDRLLESRGWKILRPCTVVADKGSGPEPDDVSIFMDEFEGLLKGQNILGEPEPGQVEICKRAPILPSHAMMLMNSSLSRDDFAKLFLANKRRFCKPGTAYTFGAICGSDQALHKCNFSKALRNDDWYPTAYCLPAEEHLLRKEMKSGGKSYWIAKPNDDFGGSGITVWSHDDAGFQKLIHDARNQKRSIVQKYLHEPMLLGPFKFHMRIHLVITSLSPLQAYVHEGGQVLCGTRPFTLSTNTLNSKFDRAVHLTNQCFNAKPANKDNYLRSKPVIGKGQQITIPELEQYLTKHHKGFDRKDLWRQIVHIAKRNAEYIVSAPTVRKHISKVESSQIFEVFGMDLMLDKNCKVFMCETNNSPGLGYPDRKILGAPNPDYDKEVKMCTSVHHDTMTLLGLDAGKKQTKGSLKHWYEIDFSAQK